VTDGRVDPPLGLDSFEAHVSASEAPAIVMIDRPFVRRLLAYLRSLERAARSADEDRA